LFHALVFTPPPPTALYTLSLHDALPISALERPDDVRRDPSPVEAALVRLHALVVDEARVHALRIEREVITDVGERERGRRVRPRRVDCLAAVDHDGVVARLALPLTERVVQARDEELHGDVVWREVVRGRLARLQDSVAARGLRDHRTAELDPQPARRRRERRRSRIVPHRLLTGTGL